jgi:hypothetical protein
MIALKDRLPDLIIVLAHDMRAFDKMPKPSRASGGPVCHEQGNDTSVGKSGKQCRHPSV